MGAWTALINRYPNPMKMVEEIGTKEALKIVKGTDDKCGIQYFAQFDKLSQATGEHLQWMLDDGISSVTECYIIARIFKEGPKIFRPKQIDLELLEEMTVNLDFSDYVQPFDTIIIELPDNFVKNRTIACHQVDELDKYPETHSPTTCILHHNRELKCILSMVLLTSDQSIKTILMEHRSGVNIEIALNELYSHTFDNSMPSTVEELTTCYNIIRAGINYCLLLDEIGIKKVGPENPNYYKRLQRYREKADNIKTQRDVRNHPMIYEFDHQVQLYRTVEHHSQLGEPTGKTIGPHHRRGHYKMQPCGKGNLERKRIRIAPVFVNAHLFGGSMKDAKTTYHT